jgi:hypothetical protein
VTGSITYDGDSHIPRKTVSVVRVAGGERQSPPSSFLVPSAVTGAETSLPLCAALGVGFSCRSVVSGG